MARNRVIYQSEALYISDDASKTASGEHKQLHRVQSANYNFSIARTDINQYGQLGRLDSIVLESPTVGVDFSYYLHDGTNEINLGFADSANFTDSQVGFLSGHFVEGSGKNLYIVTSPEGQDVNIQAETSTSYSTIGIGNAYLTDYSLEASVGSIPTVSVSMEGLNINGDAAVSGSTAAISGITSPAVHQISGTDFTSDDVVLPPPSALTGSVAALRPGDIVIDFGTAATSGTKGPIATLGDDASSSHIQSLSLNTSVSRTPIERLGSRFAYARPADFPVTASLSISAIVNDITAASLNDIIDDEIGSNITITFKKPGAAGVAQAAYQLKNAKLDSESFSSSIGSNKSVDLTFSCSIGGPSDTTNNVFFSGLAGG
jgi:hypothetical protein